MTTGTVAALVLRAIGGEPAVEQIRLRDLGPYDVRLAVEAAGVCHSDLSLSDGTMRQQVPVVLGHEGCGRVLAVGAAVQRVAVGDRVVLCWAPPCRACAFCQRAEPWLCARAGDAWAQPHATLADGTAVFPGLGTAVFAEQTVVPERACVPVDVDISPAAAALIGCAVATGVGAVLRTAAVVAGQSALVLGLGGVGLAAVQGARLAGARPLIAVDPDDGKRALALRLGATHALAPADDLAKQVRGLTDGLGVDHAFEAVGRATTIRSAWAATRRGGRVTVLGIGSATEQVSFSALEIFHFNRTLSSSVYGSVDPDRDFPTLLDLAATGQLDLSALVTREIGLADTPDAFAAMRRGEGARSVVLPSR